MATIVIYTSGTLGDHLPFIALGQALTKKGHRIRLAINQAMHPCAERFGLEAIALTDIERGPEQARANAWAWDFWNTPDQNGSPKASPFDMERFLIQARELTELCQGADLLISTSIRTLGYVVYSALELPWITVSMNPYTFWQPGTTEEQEAKRRTQLTEYNSFKPILSHAFNELSINKTIPPWSEGWLFAKHVILASSPHFSRPDLNQFQLHSSIDMTGFWFYEDPAWKDWQPEETLRRFCKRSPMVLSFSSQPLENPRQALEVHVKAAARINRPLLIQRGWAGFSEADLPPDTDSDNILFADFLPHDWLFARAACSIQHGGIGSIASALRHGCPLLIEPYGNDQIYNASRVAGNLKVGAAMHPFKMTVDGLTRVLEDKVLTSEYRQRAQALGEKIGSENGLNKACQLIETYLDQEQGNDQLSASYAPYKLSLRALSEIHREGIKEGEQISQAIPKIIHQTWKDAYIPPDLARFQRTWKRHHPDWTYLLWTDVDNRMFIQQHYPSFLNIYDNYPEHIMRVDAVRYFLLYHYGGVYVDLDFECLQPFDTLLGGKQVVFGLEPSIHLDSPFSKERGLTQIVCNAFMASVPGHPFWEHLFKQLIAYHRTPGPLDATGPFLLTRAYESYSSQETISIVPSDRIYPMNNEKSWSELEPTVQARITERAYAIHHWLGTWWREKAAKLARQVKVSLLVQGQSVTVSTMQIEQIRHLFSQQVEHPKISCLMVTKDRLILAQRAIRCFQQQTYRNRELLIVDDGEDDTLEEWTRTLDDERIVYIRLTAENKPLGELRNIAVDRASGTYVTQWDDDDLSDPERLSIQLAVIHILKTDACFLERQQIWWPESRCFSISCRRLWEGSFVCAKTRLPAYPAQAKGEDTPVIEHIARNGRIALLDLPQLYTYIFHGANTFDAEHWQNHWQTATESYEGDMYDIKLRELQSRLQFDLSEQTEHSPTILERSDKASRPASPTLPSPKAQTIATLTTPPKILILTPVKDAVSFLPRLWKNLRALTYPQDRISLAYLESDSIDNTYGFIDQHLPELQSVFARVSLFRRNYAYRSPLPRWEPRQQFKRRSVLAKSRNYLLSEALEDEEWILWLDVDVARWPDDIIEQLLAAEKDIVVPNCLSARTGETFDYNTFKLKPGAETLDSSPYIIDDIFQPPKGYGRLYLSDLRQYDCVEIDGVGGTMLFIRADLHREGLIFPPFSYKWHIETEGLALMAKDMGYQSWGLPNLEIFHP